MHVNLSGRLFEKFLSITGLEPHQVTMIGDNYISDFVNPSNLGLNAYLESILQLKIV